MFAGTVIFKGTVPDHYNPFVKNKIISCTSPLLYSFIPCQFLTRMSLVTFSQHYFSGLNLMPIVKFIFWQILIELLKFIHI